MNNHITNIALFAFFIISLILPGCADLGKLRSKIEQHGNHAILSQSEIAAGLKEALRVGSATVIKNLGHINGFNNDKIAHIVLPKNLLKVQTALRKIGYSKYMDDLELKMNRAAETATPKAKSLFVNAVKEMSWQDVQQIYKGGNDAATRYFQEKMTAPLKQAMKPVIDGALTQVGVIQSYERALSKYDSIPLIPNVRADLTQHILDKTLNAIFYYLGQEEAAIRTDPLKRTTEILRRVFGNR